MRIGLSSHYYPGITFYVVEGSTTITALCPVTLKGSPIMSPSLFCLTDEEAEAHTWLLPCYSKAKYRTWLPSFLHKTSPQLWELWENVKEACLLPCLRQASQVSCCQRLLHTCGHSPHFDTILEQWVLSKE